MTETLVMMLGLLPFFVAIPLLAKYQDMRQATLAASRTAAFECSVHFEHCHEDANTDEIANHIRRRHFSQLQTGVRSAEGVDDARMDEQRNPFWTDRAGKPMLASFADVKLDITREKMDAFNEMKAHNVPQLRLGQLAQTFSELTGPDRFGMPLSDGLITAKVQASTALDDSWLKHLPAGFTKRLNFNERTVVLVDGWHASSAKGSEARSTASRVEAGRQLPSVKHVLQALNDRIQLVPQRFIQNTVPSDKPERLLDVLYAPARFGISEDPISKNRELFHYHEVDVEIVPEDRLKKE
ncbi:MAG: hypothetical protein Q4D19_02520 [Lautropia sp.]|nr:hypothetical protein [Lautropia sp.]